jgi:glycine/D-amino acid oxidase-like deaminating enzyme
MPRHVPIWLDRFPKSRRAVFPRFRGEIDVDVAVVGGGLTGCASAASFAGAGLSVAVLEAERIGAGSTAASPGLIREDFDASFQETADVHGLRAARTLWQGLRRASLDFAAALRRYDIKCDLAPQDLLHAVRRDPDAVKRLRREYDARRAAGFDHTWMNASAVSREASLDAGAAIRTRGFVFDPFRACLGLAQAAGGRGAAFFEHTPVKRVRAKKKHVEVVTSAGTVRAQAVVIATAAPLADLRALRRHLDHQESYAVVTEPLPAAVRRELGKRAAALRDGAHPPHLLRWLKDDRALFVGADQEPAGARAREKILVQRSGQLMYELSTIYPAISGAMPEWAWELAHDSTSDGLPYIGLHRNFPRHLFALGHGRHGAAVAWLAARLLLRLFQDTPDKGDDLFGFGRILK